MYNIDKYTNKLWQSSSTIDDRSLHEVWLYPYARGIEAGSAMVMCSYNMLNGTYACENEYTLTTVLRDELGFQGATVSDWGGTHSTIDSANAGLDLSMPVCRYSSLVYICYGSCSNHLY